MELTVICDILADILDMEPEKIGPMSKLSALGIDEMDRMELEMALEETYDKEIPDGALNHMATVGDIVTYVQQWLKQ